MSDITKSRSVQKTSKLIIIDDQYILKNCIYLGTTHNLYLAIKQMTMNQWYIIRLVYIANNNLEAFQDEERLLKKLTHVMNIPKVLSQGQVSIQNVPYFYQVFDKYGPSLKLCFQYMNCRFTPQTVALIAIQILNILEKLHSQHYVHRNLKPKKILTAAGTGNRTDLFLIDFRHCLKYQHKSGKYLGMDQKKFTAMTKLNKYSSINAHLGLNPSPKDDLESLGFILVHFLRRGNLFNIQHEEISKMKKYEDNKIKLIPEKFCKGLPNEISQYFQFVRGTNIQQFPMHDYDFLKKLFRNILAGEKDYQYDWLRQLNITRSAPNSPSASPEPHPQIRVNNQFDPIQENQSENDASINKKSFYRQYSSMGFGDADEDTIRESVSAKMSLLPNMQEYIKLKEFS